MENANRPIENGTAKKINTQNPASQGGAQASRMQGQVRSQAPRSAVRRPGDTQRQAPAANTKASATNVKAPAKAAPSLNSAPRTAPAKNNSIPPQRSAVQRQPIRQVVEEQGKGFTLGNLPAVKTDDKKRSKDHYIPTRKSRIKEPMPLATIVFSILCTVLVMFMMINFVKINEYTHDIADMQAHLTKLEREEQELQVELEKKNDLSEVDLESMGLVKEEDLRKVEITDDKDETVEQYEVEEEDTGMIATVMNALARNFKEYRNIFFGGE
ncbi:MAG: hypothetical protein E7616_02920 [Ruminococcaceae bacterium]|nr:hypothetical protein [Oscillospiraceae bacterium]